MRGVAATILLGVGVARGAPTATAQSGIIAAEKNEADERVSLLEQLEAAKRENEKLKNEMSSATQMAEKITQMAENYNFSSHEELKAAAKAWCKDKDAAMGNAPHVTNGLGPS